MALVYRLAVWALLAGHLVGLGLTQLIVWDCSLEPRRGRRAAASVLGLLGDGFFLLLVYRVLFRRPDFLPILLRLSRLDGSYYQMTLVCLGLVVCMGAFPVWGFLLRWVLIRGGEPLRPRARAHALLLFLLVGAAACGGLYLSLSGAGNVCIQEVCRDDGTESGYLTLYNGGVLTLDEPELFLSDDPEDLRGLTLSQVLIAPHGLWTAELTEDMPLSIRKSGTTDLLLSNRLDQTLDRVSVPGLLNRYRFHRVSPGGEEWAMEAMFQEIGNVEMPLASAESGFYPQPFALTLSCQPGDAIYYTTDGSIPDGNSTLYTGPIAVYDLTPEPNRFRSIQSVVADWANTWKDPGNVDKAFILRAAAIAPDGSQSPVFTGTYFIGQEAYAQEQVVCLIADPQDLFGDTGIYSNGGAYEAWYAGKLAAAENGTLDAYLEENPEPSKNYFLRGRDSEREAVFTLFDGGSLALSQDVGIRIQGGSSRNVRDKRFSIYSRSQYSGSPYFDIPLLGGQYIHSLVLRDGTANAVSMEVAKGRDVAVQTAQPVAVFLNGEFWYRSYLQPKYSEKFFSQTFRVSESNVTVCRIGYWNSFSGQERQDYLDGFENRWKALDLSTPQGYAALQEFVDIQSYIDYSCINVYLNNMDTNDHQNTCLWRVNEDENSFYGDGRWRWALYDMDLTTYYVKVNEGLAKDAQVNGFSAEGAFNHAVFNQQPFYSALRQNEQFCRDFVLTFSDLMNDTFSPDRVEEALEPLGITLSYNQSFFLERPAYARSQLAEEFGLTGTPETVTLTCSRPEGGTVTLNTLAPDLTDGPWSGTYFTDYPVTVTAQPQRGYRFVQWEVGNTVCTEPSMEVAVQPGGVSIRAVFEEEQP